MFRYVKRIEELESGIVSSMIVASGIGSMIFTWDIDYTVGCGVISDNEKCIWTKEGLRTSCSYDRGVFIIDQSKEVDPLYSILEHKYSDKNKRKGV